MNGEMALRLRADPTTFSGVRRLIGQVVELLGGSNEDALELEVAAGEALTNVFRHAYGATPGQLEVDLVFNDQKIEVRIHDHGEVQWNLPAFPMTLPEGHEHRGLYLMGQLTDHVEVVQPGHGRSGTTIRMTKYISKARLLARMLGMDADPFGHDNVQFPRHRTADRSWD